MRNDIDIIKRALDIYSRYETEAIEKSIENLPPLSPSFYTRLDERAEEIKLSNKKSISFKKAITILVAATLIIACLSVVAYAVAERTKIGGFFVEWFEGHAKLSNDDEKNENVSLDNVSVNYLPDGFLMTNNEISARRKFFVWENDISTLEFTVSILTNGNIFIDTENGYSILTVGEYTVHKNVYPEEICVLWEHKGIVYSLKGINFTWEELIKIVEGISYEDATA